MHEYWIFFFFFFRGGGGGTFSRQIQRFTKLRDDLM